MVLARLVHLLHPRQRALGIPAPRLAKGFVLADVVSFAVQAAGGAMMANQDGGADKVRLGQHVYMAGVGVQLAFVLVFVVVVVAFHRDMMRLRRSGKVEGPGGGRVSRWVRPLIWVVYVVLGLIVVSDYN